MIAFSLRVLGDAGMMFRSWQRGSNEENAELRTPSFYSIPHRHVWNSMSYFVENSTFRGDPLGSSGVEEGLVSGGSHRFSPLGSSILPGRHSHFALEELVEVTSFVPDFCTDIYYREIRLS